MASQILVVPVASAVLNPSPRGRVEGVRESRDDQRQGELRWTNVCSPSSSLDLPAPGRCRASSPVPLSQTDGSASQIAELFFPSPTGRGKGGETGVSRRMRRARRAAPACQPARAPQVREQRRNRRQPSNRSINSQFRQPTLNAQPGACSLAPLLAVGAPTCQRALLDGLAARGSQFSSRPQPISQWDRDLTPSALRN